MVTTWRVWFSYIAGVASPERMVPLKAGPLTVPLRMGSGTTTPPGMVIGFCVRVLGGCPSPIATEKTYVVLKGRAEAVVANSDRSTDSGVP